MWGSEGPGRRRGFGVLFGERVRGAGVESQGGRAFGLLLAMNRGCCWSCLREAVPTVILTESCRHCCWAIHSSKAMMHCSCAQPGDLT